MSFYTIDFEDPSTQFALKTHSVVKMDDTLTAREMGSSGAYTNISNPINMILPRKFNTTDDSRDVGRFVEDENDRQFPIPTQHFAQLWFSPTVITTAIETIDVINNKTIFNQHVDTSDTLHTIPISVGPFVLYMSQGNKDVYISLEHMANKYIISNGDYLEFKYEQDFKESQFYGYKISANVGYPWIVEDIGTMYISLYSKSINANIPDRRLHICLGSVGIAYEGDESAITQFNSNIGICKIGVENFNLTTFNENSLTDILLRKNNKTLSSILDYATKFIYYVGGSPTIITPTDMKTFKVVGSLSDTSFTIKYDAVTVINVETVIFGDNTDTNFFTIDNTGGTVLNSVYYNVPTGLAHLNLEHTQHLPTKTKSWCLTSPSDSWIFTDDNNLPSHTKYAASRILRHRFEKERVVYNVDIRDVFFPENIEIVLSDKDFVLNSINKQLNGLSIYGREVIEQNKHYKSFPEYTSVPFNLVVGMWQSSFGNKIAAKTTFVYSNGFEKDVKQFKLNSTKLELSYSFAPIHHQNVNFKLPVSTSQEAEEAAQTLSDNFITGADNVLWNSPNMPLLLLCKRLRRYARLIEISASYLRKNSEHMPEWSATRAQIIEDAVNHLWIAVKKILNGGVGLELVGDDTLEVSYSADSNEQDKPFSEIVNKWQHLKYDKHFGGFTNSVSFELYKWAILDNTDRNKAIQLSGITNTDYATIITNGTLAQIKNFVEFSDYEYHHFVVGYVCYFCYVVLKYGGKTHFDDVIYYLTTLSPPSGSETHEPYPLLQLILDIAANSGPKGQGVVAPATTDGVVRRFPPHRCFDVFDGRSFMTGIGMGRGFITYRGSSSESIACYEGVVKFLSELKHWNGGSLPKIMSGLISENVPRFILDSEMAQLLATNTELNDFDKTNYLTLTFNVSKKQVYPLYGSLDSREQVVIESNGTIIGEHEIYPYGVFVTSESLLSLVPKKQHQDGNVLANTRGLIDSGFTTGKNWYIFSQFLNYIPSGADFSPSTDLTKYTTTECYETTKEWFKHFNKSV